MSSSQNINISLKHKSISNNSAAVVGTSSMSYSPSSHTMPAIFQHRDSFAHQRELESAFCSDLVCCGTRVRDLHELLHHYEEHHHAPIEEEPESTTTTKDEDVDEEESSTSHQKQGNSDDNGDEDHDIVMDDISGGGFPSQSLPTQPHELAAISANNPLIRNRSELRMNKDTTTTATTTTTSPIKDLNIAEEMFRQAAALSPLIHPQHHQQSQLPPEFSAEVLYQTCDDGQDKPYKCAIAGCDKAYKNPNGLKYHQMHGHSEEDSLSDAERDAQKPYMCTIGYCNKRYKNLNGLKYHIEHSHIAKLKQYPPVANNNNNNSTSLNVHPTSNWQPPTF